MEFFGAVGGASAAVQVMAFIFGVLLLLRLLRFVLHLLGLA